MTTHTCYACGQVNGTPHPLCTRCFIVRYVERSYPSFAERAALWNYECAYCGGMFAEVDHVAPLYKLEQWYGRYIFRDANAWRLVTDNLDNLVPSCTRCNRSKGKRDLEQWYKSRAYYSQPRFAKVLKHLSLEILVNLESGI